MPIELGFIIFVIVIFIFVLTRKKRKEYHAQPITYFILVHFKKKPDGLMENKVLKEVGYWYQDSDKTYHIESKIKVDELIPLILSELNLSRSDFSIRENTDLFVPQGRL